MPPTRATAKAMTASASGSAGGSRSTRSSARVPINAKDESRKEKVEKRALQGESQPKTRRMVQAVPAATSKAAEPVKQSLKRKASGITGSRRKPPSGAITSSDSNEKDFMLSGIYCQDPHPDSPRKLANRVLARRQAELKSAKKKGKAKAVLGETITFPPMPYDYGNKHFFEQEHEFMLPFEIHRVSENGLLDSRKRPDAYAKIRQNAFPERAKDSSDITAVCRCTPESGCNDGCDNRIMHYTCGKGCPAGEACNNKSLWKRKQPSLKVAYTGTRGFGLFAKEDIKEGDFVIDYRGEIIDLSTFYERCDANAECANYYALAYDQDEVIDAAVRGNEARFINHGCQPNLEVRKVSALGDGVEEFEVGMWAARDILSGEELCYDYNFDSFAAATATECRCGATDCVGFLGRNPSDKSVRKQR